MKAEYFSDLSISKRVIEQALNEQGEMEALERHVDYKKVTFYIPKSDLVQEGINFDEYARWSLFHIFPAHNDMVLIGRAELEALKQGGAWVMPSETKEALKTAIAVMADLMEEK